MKAVKAHLEKTNPDRVAAFEKGAAAFAKKVVANFKDFEFVRISSASNNSPVLTQVSAAHWGEYERRWTGVATEL